MSESGQRGPIRSTPEGGPLDEGIPSTAPGAGQVQPTPEAGPLDTDVALAPPTWREHMRGPIPGVDDAPSAAAREEPGAQRRAAAGEPAAPAASAASREEAPSDEFEKWPPHTGKPVSEVGWKEIGRYAAPIAAQAEKLAIKGIDLSARGLTKLARYLEARREGR
jgi:hypothetical protein